jgi:hypothetical protein
VNRTGNPMIPLRQILRYLRQRGILSRDQLDGWAAQGILRKEDVPEEERVVQPAPASGLKAGDIGRWLAERFDSWQAQLQGLCRLGWRLNGCATWAESALRVRHAAPQDLCVAIARGLEERDPPLNALWDSLALEAYYDILTEPAAHGPAADAYRAVLTVEEQARLGPHAWLLGELEVAAVFNLKQAQRRLLRAAEQVHRFWPGLVAVALNRDYHPLAYWSLVLLYSARHGPPGGRSVPDEDEHRPARPLPDEAGWLQAWGQAAVMDFRSVTGFLLECSRRRSCDWVEDLVCPRRWG